MSIEPGFFRKSNPQPGDVYVAPLLTSVAYTYLSEEMMAQSAAMATARNSIIPSALQQSYYTKYNKDDILRAITEPRAPGGAFAGIGHDIDNSNSFNCVVYGAESEIPDEVRANYTLQLSLESARTKLLTRAGVARREQKFADTLFATSGSWDKVVAGTTSTPTPGTDFKKWNAAGSTPIADIKYGKTYILDNTGMEANTLILSQSVWDAITENGDVVDRLIYSNRGVVTADLFAEACGLKRVIVSKFIRTTSNKGAATATRANLLGDKALLCYLPDAPGPGIPAAFQQFVWEGLVGSVDGMRVLKLRDDRHRQDILQIEDAFDTKITCADLGFLFNDCT